mgnify:CR=1 FL=1
MVWSLEKCAVPTNIFGMISELGTDITRENKISTCADGEFFLFFKMKLPKMIYGSTGLSADISEAVEVNDVNGNKKSMLIINIDSVFARASESMAS